MSGCRWCGSTGKVGAKKQHVCEECGGTGKLYTEAEVALLRRQVDVLCERLSGGACPCTSDLCPQRDAKSRRSLAECARHWREWSLARASEPGGECVHGVVVAKEGV